MRDIESNYKILFQCFILLSVLLSSISFLFNIGCSNNYETFTQRDWKFEFTFQYPLGYEVRTVDKYPGMIHVVAKLPTQDDDWRPPESQYDTSFSIYVYSINTYPEFLDAKARMEEMISFSKTTTDYRFIKRIAIDIDGIPAELYEYSRLWDLITDTGPRGITTQVIREVMFDYDGYVWSISQSSYGTELGKKEEVTWKLLLRSFDILD